VSQLDPTNPFRPGDLELINQQLKQLQITQAMIDKCGECGLEVTGYDSDCKGICGSLQRVKQVFFPQSN
jgi:hypothetical protein